MDNNELKYRHSDVEALMNSHPPVPKRIMLEVSSICNHKCIFCASISGDSRKKVVIDKNLAISIIKQGSELQMNEICFHCIGEPLICKDLCNYVKLSKELGYGNVYIDTNGALATPEIINPIIDAGIDDIKFSVNASNREDYTKVHGKDDFDQVIDNIKRLHEYIVDTSAHTKIYVSFVETNITYGQWKTLRDILDNYIDKMWVFKIHSFGGGIVESYNLLSTESENNKDNDVCMEPFDRIIITADGFFTACCYDSNYKFVYGDANKQSIKEAWYSDNIIALRNQHLTGENINKWCKLCDKIIWANKLN